MTDISPEKYYNPDREGDQRRTNDRRVFEVSEMSELHHEITRRLLLGQKQKEIAEQLGCHAQTVSNVKNSQVVQDKLAIMRGARDANSVDVAKEIQRIAPQALENLRKVIEDETEEVPLSMKVKESNNMLDRAGYGARQKSEHRHLHGHFTAEDIDDIKKRALDAGAMISESDDTEDAEFNETDYSS